MALGHSPQVKPQDVSRKGGRHLRSEVLVWTTHSIIIYHPVAADFPEIRDGATGSPPRLIRYQRVWRRDDTSRGPGPGRRKALAEVLWCEGTLAARAVDERRRRCISKLFTMIGSSDSNI